MATWAVDDATGRTASVVADAFIKVAWPVKVFPVAADLSVAEDLPTFGQVWP